MKRAVFTPGGLFAILAGLTFTRMEKPKKIKPPPIGFLIRELRIRGRLTAREISKRVGIDPRLLNSIEKGRIRNPSIDRLSEIAQALGMSLTHLIMLYEGKKIANFSKGSSTGEFVMNFEKKGVKLVSYTPPIREMFCGKMILGGKKKLDQAKFTMPATIFVQVILGKIIVEYQDEEVILGEGKNLLINGEHGFCFLNPTHRDASILFFSAPAPWGQPFLRPE